MIYIDVLFIINWTHDFHKQPNWVKLYTFMYMSFSAR